MFVLQVAVILISSLNVDAVGNFKWVGDDKKSQTLLLNLSNDIIQDCNRRIDNITYIKFENMESPSFEVGYITYILQETYRNMVDKYNSSYYQDKIRRVGIESLTVNRRQESSNIPPSDDDNSIRMKLFRLMYETVRDSDVKYKRAELIKNNYSNSSDFEIGFIIGEVTDKFKVMSDIAETLKRLYEDWTPIEHINAYEQIANRASEISHLIDMVRIVIKRNEITTFSDPVPQSWKFQDRIPVSTKSQLINMTREILIEAKYQVRQLRGIRAEHAKTLAFQTGIIIGKCREKYKRMMETYRDINDRMDGRNKFYGPGFKTYKNIYPLLAMETIRNKEKEIDSLIHVLEMVPQRLFNGNLSSNELNDEDVNGITERILRANETEEEEAELKRKMREEYENNHLDSERINLKQNNETKEINWISNAY